MGTVLQFKQREEKPLPAAPLYWYEHRMMMFDYDRLTFRYETDGEYAARLKRLES